MALESLTVAARSPVVASETPGVAPKSPSITWELSLSVLLLLAKRLTVGRPEELTDGVPLPALVPEFTERNRFTFNIKRKKDCSI